ncbi:hypothetical protein B0T10DRAFT_464659 [Thelonectria olida]|uniref:Uncharacterized protein n=1 Tax=Thelonectria olida TaxID=1576542 RepID=A0A9P8VUM9_9HYPO|nr:hypothetical protein B0T10DRAFT_464659 [Thelonectria olida]
MNPPYHQVDPQEIQSFLNPYQNGYQVAQPSTSYTPTMPRTYYAPEIMMGDEYSAPRSDFSGGTSQTPYSSGFSEGYGGNAYSISTAPSTSGYERDFHQHPFQVSARPRLPCEFDQFRQRCEATFDIDDEEAWIEHLASVHLNYSYPKCCICWFCSSKYVAKSDSNKDRWECFRKRMHHIARHLRDNERTWDDMRPDFHFIDHVRRLRIIGEEEYSFLRRHSEVPQFPTFRPAGFRQPMREQSVPEVARGRHGKHKKSKKDRTPQLYHQ